MKGSAITHAAQSEEPSQESAFQRFAKVILALIAVPKRELEEKIATDKAKRRSESRKAG